MLYSGLISNLEDARLADIMYTSALHCIRATQLLRKRRLAWRDPWHHEECQMPGVLDV